MSLSPYLGKHAEKVAGGLRAELPGEAATGCQQPPRWPASYTRWGAPHANASPGGGSHTATTFVHVLRPSVDCPRTRVCLGSMHSAPYSVWDQRQRTHAQKLAC